MVQTGHLFNSLIHVLCHYKTPQRRFIYTRVITHFCAFAVLRLCYAVLQVQAKSNSVIRFLIPLTLIASQKLCTYSMCLVLEMQGKGKVIQYFLQSG